MVAKLIFRRVPVRFLSHKLVNTQPAFFTEAVPGPVKSGRFEDRCMSVNIRFTRNILGKMSSVQL